METGPDVAETPSRDRIDPARLETRMIWKDVIEIDDGAVEVVVIAPDNMNNMNLQELAGRAWCAPGISVDKATVKVAAWQPRQSEDICDQQLADYGDATAPCYWLGWP